MGCTKRRLQIESNKISDSVWVNNRTFDWQVTLPRRRIYDDRIKEQMDIINVKWKDHCSEMNEMGKQVICFKDHGIIRMK